MADATLDGEKRLVITIKPSTQRDLTSTIKLRRSINLHGKLHRGISTSGGLGSY